MIKKILYLTLIIIFCFNSFAQTSDCNNNAGGQITVGTSCNPVTFNSNNNTDYWNGATGCNASDVDDVWGWFIATTNSTTITYNTSDNNRDPVLTLFTGGCNPNMTSIACADNGLDGDSETINYATTVGVTYRVRVQDWNSNSNMNGTICVYSSTPP